MNRSYLVHPLGIETEIEYGNMSHSNDALLINKADISS
ncbi:hypothetical protein S7335_5547 [Synechococcus sp. PCC 7335]|nr:hypothetical protein S7335_5547 [Synechococcus sp. PCC 7335]